MFFEQTVTADNFCDFLNQFVATLDEEEIHSAWFQLDNALKQDQAALTQCFGPRIISKGLFPPRSPDLTPLDFFLWGFLKDCVYSNNPQTLDDLKNNITDEINHISHEWLKTL